MPLDALDGDEQRIGDLSIALTRGGELGNAPLPRGQPVDRCPCAGGHPPAGHAQLGPGGGSHGLRPDVLCECKCIAQDRPGLGWVAGATDGGTEVAERAGVLDAGAAAIQHSDRGPLQLHSVVTAPNAGEGELKLYGRAVRAGREALDAAPEEAWWHAFPPERSQVFLLDVDRAVFVEWDLPAATMTVRRWSAEGGVEQSTRSYP